MQVLETLVRRDLPLDALPDALNFYGSLLGAEPTLDLHLADGDLRIVQLGAMLLVAASPALAAQVVRADAVYVVRDIDAFVRQLDQQGVDWLQPLADIVTGKNLIVRHPDGLVVEYVEHLEQHG